MSNCTHQDKFLATPLMESFLLRFDYFTILVLNFLPLFHLQVENLKSRKSILDSMDEKLKTIAEFNVQIKEFDTIMNELAAWLGVGRKRMDELV